MNDTKAAKLNHERGTKHQENLAKKLRDMSRKADAEKRGKEQAAAAMDNIEQLAREQYEKDQQAAKAQAGNWVWNESSGYYYNALHRWYYDHKTGWYYGGCYRRPPDAGGGSDRRSQGGRRITNSGSSSSSSR
eukprot:gene5007-5248_t